MHGFIRDELENLLAAKRVSGGASGSGAVTNEHLSACTECAQEVSAMREQADFLRSLRAAEEAEPTAGFYARVLQRIEERAKESVWAAFIYSTFGKRLALASATIAVILGTLVVAQESHDGHLSNQALVAEQVEPSDAPVIGNQAQQRDAVLVNFVSYRGPVQ